MTDSEEGGAETFEVVYVLASTPEKVRALPQRMGLLSVGPDGIVVKDQGPAINPAAMAGAGILGGAIGGAISGVAHGLRVERANARGIRLTVDPAAAQAYYDTKMRTVSLGMADGKWLAVQPGESPIRLASPEAFQRFVSVLGSVLRLPMQEAKLRKVDLTRLKRQLAWIGLFAVVAFTIIGILVALGVLH